MSSRNFIAQRAAINNNNPNARNLSPIFPIALRVDGENGAAAPLHRPRDYHRSARATSSSHRLHSSADVSYPSSPERF